MTGTESAKARKAKRRLPWWQALLLSVFLAGGAGLVVVFKAWWDSDWFLLGDLPWLIIPFVVLLASMLLLPLPEKKRQDDSID